MIYFLPFHFHSAQFIKIHPFYTPICILIFYTIFIPLTARLLKFFRKRITFLKKIMYIFKLFTRLISNIRFTLTKKN